MAQTSIKHSMPQLMISFTMLNQATRPLTVVAVTLNQLGRLANTPKYLPAAAVLAGYLLAIYRRDYCIPRREERSIHVLFHHPLLDLQMYLLHDLPRTTAAVLSSTEILEKGGWCGNE